MLPNRVVISLCGLTVLLGGCVELQPSAAPYYKTPQERQDAVQEQGFQVDPRPLVSPEQEEPATAGDPQDVLMPSLRLANDRIDAYEQKLEAIKHVQEEALLEKGSQNLLNDISSCRVKAKNVLLAYNALNKRLLRQTELEAAALLAGTSLLKVTAQDYQYLESGCEQFIQPAVSSLKPPEPSEVRTLYQEEQTVRKAFEQADYSKVIDLYSSLPLAEQQRPSFNSTFLYAQALMRSRREAEARKVLVDLLADIRAKDQAQWEVRLLRLIGDLEFGIQLYDGARDRFEEMVRMHEKMKGTREWAEQQLAALSRGYKGEEVVSYAALLKSYLGYSAERDGFSVVEQAERYIEKFPYSPAASNVDALLEDARRKANAWLDAVCARIDELAAARKFQEALLLIERIPRGILPPDKQEILRRKNDELMTAESISIETERLVQEQELQEAWNRGMTSLEGKQYDQAIEIFTSLLSSPYESKAKARIDEAATLAAHDDRQRAAELFVRANRTADLGSRQKLLLASKKLLQDILIKYPQAGLSEKVERNLSRINEEIRLIDPALLTTPTTVNGAFVQEENLPAEEAIQKEEIFNN